jgi:hypothetical protein
MVKKLLHEKLFPSESLFLEYRISDGEKSFTNFDM